MAGGATAGREVGGVMGRVGAFDGPAAQSPTSQNVNILFRYENDYGMNLMHLAAESQNDLALKRLLKIEAEHIVHELKHSLDGKKLFPHQLLQNTEFAAQLFPESVSWHTYLTGSTASGVYMEERRQPDPKAGIWMVPVHMPPPLSALEDNKKNDVAYITPGVLANLLFWVNEENTLSRMEQLVAQFLTEHGFATADDDVFSSIKTIMQIQSGDDQSAKAKVCIDRLKEALTMECRDHDDHEFGTIYLICTGLMDLNCFQFLLQIADLIYGAEDAKKVLAETYHDMKLLDVAIQTFNDDVMDFVLSLDLPIESPIQPGQQNKELVCTLEDLPNVPGGTPCWTAISIAILRGNVQAVRQISNYCLEQQKKYLTLGKILPDVYRPTFMSDGQTYQQLLFDRSCHTGFNDDDDEQDREYFLNNWYCEVEELDEIELQNKNKSEDRRKMKEILKEWETQFNQNNAAHRI